MTPSSLLDSLYERAASFGRDVFHYIVTGTMFAIVCSMPWWLSIPWEEVRGSSQIAVLFVAATVLFGLGHVLLAIGFWIRNKIIRPGESRWDKSWNWVFLRLANCRDQVDEYNCATDRARQASPGTLVVGNESTADVHVGLEMSVLLKQPRLHGVFIERYNTLWHLRLGLAASLLIAGVVNLVFAVCSFDVTTCCRDQRSAIVACVVGLASIFAWPAAHASASDHEHALPSPRHRRFHHRRTGEPMRYFAYGSNMLTRRVTAPSRAPSACACGIAGVPGFVVRFHKMGADGSGKCTLVAADDAAAVAYGVLYELTDSDGTKLDRPEGVHTGGYSRCSIQLRCLDGGITGAVTYIANDRHVNPACVPFDWYRDLVVAGAIEHGLPASYVGELVRVPAVPDLDSARAAQARRLLDGS